MPEAAPQTDRTPLHRRGVARYLVRLAAVVAAVLPIGFTMADESSSVKKQDEFFRKSVAPVFREHCLSCHNSIDRKGELSLETPEDLSVLELIGPTAAQSRLAEVLLVTDGTAEMPPNQKPLSPSEAEAVTQWIDHGAFWPEGLRLSADESLRFDWWSYMPLPDSVTVPQPVAAGESGTNPIDAFLLDRLQKEGLTPNPIADRFTLLRRITFDLTGLPPTEEEIRDFLSDQENGAWTRVTDRLLNSPAYGERWAQHWLDVARYADTCGYDKDKLRPNAWPYRDYVIQSLNEDRPYGDFVREQIAADVLFPDAPEKTAALGFLAAGPWDFIGHVEVPESKLDGMEARNLDRDDMVSASMNAFCSLTVQCARCHHHKFEPITQQHYYNLQSVFAAVDRAERPYGVASEPGGPLPMVYAAATHFKAQGNFRPTEGTPRTIRVLHRGNLRQPLEDARPGTIPLRAGDTGLFPSSDDLSEGDRRAALADWLTRPENPFTWRSVVNRVWQHHFGIGLVATPNDFGRMGDTPSHPELLNWLAVDFRDNGQSLKRLHRMICTSEAYRRTSDGSNPAAESDRSNRLLWKMQRRRLSAEETRDAMLVAAGLINRESGGPGFRTFELERPEHSPHYEYHKFDPADPASHRRSIYRFVVRSQPDPWMNVMDCADSSQSTPRRTETLTAHQALVLLNSPFAAFTAEKLAEFVSQKNETSAGQTEAAFRRVTQRDPTVTEAESLDEYRRKHGLPATCRLLWNLSEFVYVD